MRGCLVRWDKDTMVEGEKNVEYLRMYGIDQFPLKVK